MRWGSAHTFRNIAPLHLIFDSLRPCGYCMYRIHVFYLQPTECISMFCTDLRTSNDFFLMQIQLIGFYNRVGKCLLRGMDWVFKYSFSILIFMYVLLLPERQTGEVCGPARKRCFFRNRATFEEQYFNLFFKGLIGNGKTPHPILCG